MMPKDLREPNQKMVVFRHLGSPKDVRIQVLDLVAIQETTQFAFASLNPNHSEALRSLL
jgi:hypothetical protein